MTNTVDTQTQPLRVVWTADDFDRQPVGTLIERHDTDTGKRWRYVKVVEKDGETTPAWLLLEGSLHPRIHATYYTNGQMGFDSRYPELIYTKLA